MPMAVWRLSIAGRSSRSSTSGREQASRVVALLRSLVTDEDLRDLVAAIEVRTGGGVDFQTSELEDVFDFLRILLLAKSLGVELPPEVRDTMLKLKDALEVLLTEIKSARARI